MGNLPLLKRLLTYLQFTSDAGKQVFRFSKQTNYKDILTLEEAADYLNTEKRKLLEEVSIGNLPGRQIGGEWRFSKSALENALNKWGQKQLIAMDSTTYLLSSNPNNYHLVLSPRTSAVPSQPLLTTTLSNKTIIPVQFFNTWSEQLVTRLDSCDAGIVEKLLSEYAQGRRDFSKLNLTDADLFGAEIPGIVLSHACLRKADLSETDLSEADLSYANLYAANLLGAKLSGANLKGAVLCEAELMGADLSSANLFQTNLSQADLIGTVLQGADLREADLRGADLRKADLRDADLRNTDLRDAKL